MVKFIKIGKKVFNLNAIIAIEPDSYDKAKIYLNGDSYINSEVTVKTILKHPEIRKALKFTIKKEREEDEE